MALEHVGFIFFSLLAFGQHVDAISSRAQSSTGIKPYFGPAESLHPSTGGGSAAVPGFSESAAGHRSSSNQVYRGPEPPLGNAFVLQTKLDISVPLPANQYQVPPKQRQQASYQAPPRQQQQVTYQVPSGQQQSSYQQAGYQLPSRQQAGYQQASYQAPPRQQQQATYQAPSGQQQATYQAPPRQQQQATYQVPSGQQQSSYQQSSYQVPSRQQAGYQQSSYQAPPRQQQQASYQAPSGQQQSSYQQASYLLPSRQQSSYQAPSRQQSSYQAPSRRQQQSNYQAPNMVHDDGVLQTEIDVMVPFPGKKLPSRHQSKPVPPKQLNNQAEQHPRNNPTPTVYRGVKAPVQPRSHRPIFQAQNDGVQTKIGVTVPFPDHKVPSRQQAGYQAGYQGPSRQRQQASYQAPSRQQQASYQAPSRQQQQASYQTPPRQQQQSSYQAPSRQQSSYQAPSRRQQQASYQTPPRQQQQASYQTSYQGPSRQQTGYQAPSRQQDLFPAVQSPPYDLNPASGVIQSQPGRRDGVWASSQSRVPTAHGADWTVVSSSRPIIFTDPGAEGPAYSKP